jgi:hypothetical protein
MQIGKTPRFSSIPFSLHNQSLPNKAQIKGLRRYKLYKFAETFLSRYWNREKEEENERSVASWRFFQG